MRLTRTVKELDMQAASKTELLIFADKNNLEVFEIISPDDPNRPGDTSQHWRYVIYQGKIIGCQDK